MSTHRTSAELLRDHGLKPKKSWGQNFLDDEGVLDELIEAMAIEPSEVVVELGPGLGHLTRRLLATGAKVTAVERDRDMVRVLKALDLPGLDLVEGNAADIQFAQAANAPEVVVVGNLPYHLSSSILFEVLEQPATVKRALFTLQKEVVERLAAPPGNRDYGILSVLLGLRFRVEKCFEVPAHRFHPPPKVDSAVVRLTRLPKPRAEVREEARFRKIVKAAFAQRRKTLPNSLHSDKVLCEGIDVKAVLARCNIDEKRRAETLSVEEFAALEREWS
jgi:16S rRNA (adenine1518-N6/adenine1519-N6)-dimethyltransferase